jgi:hypothetical protein
VQISATVGFLADTCVVAPADLHQIIRSGQQLSNSHIQYFLYQILRGMKASWAGWKVRQSQLTNTLLDIAVYSFGKRDTSRSETRKFAS